jgi:hypothetical protein
MITPQAEQTAGNAGHQGKVVLLPPAVSDAAAVTCSLVVLAFQCIATCIATSWPTSAHL